MTLLFVLATALFFFAKKQEDSVALLFQMAVIAGLLIVRFAMLGHESRDYQVFLSDWLTQMRDAPGWSALKMDIGDYNAAFTDVTPNKVKNLRIMVRFNDGTVKHYRFGENQTVILNR